MAGRTSYYGGVVLDGLVFHVDASKQESFGKRGIRYAQAGNTSFWVDFADVSKNPSTANATGSVINGATFSNFAPYHLSGYPLYANFYHDKSNPAWTSSAGIGTFFGNIEFDGSNDYIDFGPTPDMSGLTDITVSAWVYINRFRGSISPSGGTTSIIASRYSNTTGNNGWELAYDNNGIAWFGGREIAGADKYIIATSSYKVKASNAGGFTANGGWYNIVGTKAGMTWSIYVAAPCKYRDYYNPSIVIDSGRRIEKRGMTARGDGVTVFGNNNLVVGRASNAAQYYMDRRLMQLSVYNRALSDQEIKQNYLSFSNRVFEIEGNSPLLSLNWVTSTNVTSDPNCLETFPGSGVPSGWKVSNYGKTIRFDVSRSAQAGCPLPEGTCAIQQFGWATASITVGPNPTYLTLDFSGMGELWDVGYDKIQFKLNGNLIAKAEAPGGRISQCEDGPVIKTFYDGVGALGTGATVPSALATNPYRYLLPANTSHILELYLDTGDGAYHYNSYYEAIIGFEN